jgi:hypothetical protein
VFAVSARDNRQVYSARQPQPNAVDVRFADVQVKDLLQHYVAQARGVDRRQQVVVQEIAVQYSLVLQHSVRVGEQEPAVIDGGVIVWQLGGRARP